MNLVVGNKEEFCFILILFSDCLNWKSIIQFKIGCKYLGGYDFSKLLGLSGVGSEYFLL